MKSVVWYAVIALLVTALALPDQALATSAPHLTQVVRNLSGRQDARVSCVRLDAGSMGQATKQTGVILLANDVCFALRTRVLNPRYPRSSTVEALFTLAHEAGHLVTPGGVRAESQADCYAWRNWRRYGRALGFGNDIGLPLGRCWK